MILVNLARHRAASARSARSTGVLPLALSLALGAAVVVGWAVWLDRQTTESQSATQTLEATLTELRGREKEVRALRSEIAALQAREKTVGALQFERHGALALLAALAEFTPEGVVLSGIRQTDGQVVVSGLARSSDRVSALVDGLQQSPHVMQPEILEVKLAAAPEARVPGAVPAAGARGVPLQEAERPFEFSLRLVVRRGGRS